MFALDTTGDLHQPEYWLYVEYRADGGTAGRLETVEILSAIWERDSFPGSVTVADNRVVARVPLSTIGWPASVAFCAVSSAGDGREWIQRDTIAEDADDCLSGPLLLLTPDG